MDFFNELIEIIREEGSHQPVEIAPETYETFFEDFSPSPIKNLNNNNSQDRRTENNDVSKKKIPVVIENSEPITSLQQPTTLNTAKTLISSEELSIKKDISTNKLKKLYSGVYFDFSIVGGCNPKVVFIGEARSRNSNDSEPINLLKKMIEAMQLPIDDAMILDIYYKSSQVLTSKSNNKAEIEKDIKYCLPYIEKIISEQKPMAIVFLGPFPLKLLLNKQGVSLNRGQWFEYMGVKVMVTYHPALLLRNTSKKKETWEDLKQVMAEIKKDEYK